MVNLVNEDGDRGWVEWKYSFPIILLLLFLTDY